MEGEYEILKKYFIEKEKENIQLKEELELMKMKSEPKSNSIKLTNVFSNNFSNNTNKTATNTNQDTPSHGDLTTNFQDNKLCISNDNMITEILSPTTKSVYFKKDTDEKKENMGLASKVSNNLNLNINKLNKRSKSEMTSREIPEFNSSDISYVNDGVNNNSHIRENKTNYLELGRLYEEKTRSCTSNILSVNKGVIKNIGTNISELKKHLNTYEKAYEIINSKIDASIMSPKKEFFNSNQISNFDDIHQIKEFYENEIKIKNGMYEQNISLLRKTHQENIKKVRIEYEDKIDLIIKTSEEEKSILRKKITSLNNEVELKNLKSGFNDRNDMVDFQKKYLNEMKELQKTFEDFKLKTYDDFKILRKAKEDALSRATYYKESFDKLKEGNEISESFSTNKENYGVLKTNIDQMKTLLKKNELLKTQLEASKVEVNSLKSKPAKIENSKVSKTSNVNRYNQNNENNNLVNPHKGSGNIQIDMNYLSECGESHPKNNLFSHTGKSSDIVNYENFSYFNGNYKDSNGNVFSPQAMGGERYISHNGHNSSEHENIVFNDTGYKFYNPYPNNNTNNNNNNNNNNQLSYNTETLDEKLYKVIDLKKAHHKIKEMEDCLKSMNDENEDLKGRLGYVMSNINTPILTESNSVTNNYIISTPMDQSKNNMYTPNKSHKGRTHSQIIDNNNYYNNNSSSEVKHSASFVKFQGRNLENNRELTPTINKTGGNVSNTFTLKTKNTREAQNQYVPSTTTRDQMNSKYQQSPLRLRGKTLNTNTNAISKDNLYDTQETMDENIVEFPLQLRIKGKITKITANTSSAKRKHPDLKY